MKPMTEAERGLNEQAASVATSALNEPVVAATRFEQITMDMAAGAAGVGAINRGMMRGMMSMNKMSSVGRMGDGLRTGGLPNTFILAVTATQVHAIEEKEHRGTLTAGKVLKSWDREGFRAKLSNPIANTASGIPDDRQVIILSLPIEGGNNRYLKAAAVNTAAVGGMPHKFAIAKDAPSQSVIDAICQANAAPNVMIGGTNIQDMLAQAGMPVAPAAPDATERLTKLADLHDRGVLTDEEFSAQKAKILSTM